MELLPIREPRFRQVGYIRPFYAPHPPKTITPPETITPPLNPGERTAFLMGQKIYTVVYIRYGGTSRGRKHNYTYTYQSSSSWWQAPMSIPAMPSTATRSSTFLSQPYPPPHTPKSRSQNPTSSDRHNARIFRVLTGRIPTGRSFRQG